MNIRNGSPPDQFENDLERDIDEQMDDDYEPDDYEEDMANCHGWFDPDPETGVFVCGAAGSEDCDECPLHEWCGLTNQQIDELEETTDPAFASTNHG